MNCGIVILNYNSYGLTCDLINRIENFEMISHIILVDNNSNDNFDNYIKEKKSDKIHYIKNDINSGYASGNNVGLKYLYSLGIEYAFIANPDVVFDENTINCIVNFLDKNKNYAVVSCKRTIGKNGITGQYWNIPSFCDCLAETCYFGRKRMDSKFKKNFYEIWNNNDAEYKNVEVVGGAFFGCNLRIMHEINYLDERTFLWYEENILGFKIRAANYYEAILLNCSYVHNHFKHSHGNKKHSIYVKSKKIYCRFYLKINFFQRILLGFFDLIGTIEARVLYWLGKVIKR